MLDSRNSLDVPAPPARRFPWWLLGLLLLAALVGVWLLMQPKSYHYVASYKAYDRTLAPCTSGFLLRESLNTFVLRDWHGHERWRVTSAKPVPIKNVEEEYYLNYYVSPNGHIFAVIAANGQRMSMQVWQDGRKTTEIHTKADADVFSPNVRPLDDGRVFAWYRTVRAGRKTIFMLIRQGRIIARDSARIINFHMSPDGTVVAGNSLGTSYASLRVEKDSIVLGKPQKTAGSLQMESRPIHGGESALFAEVYVLATDGTVHGPKGLVSASKGWEHDTIAPGGRYTLEQRGEQSRVFSPKTGMSWSFTVKGENYGGDATPDGRFALAYFRPGEAAWAKQVRKVPWLNEHVSTDNGQVIALYERPGRLRAVVPKKEIDRWWNNSFETWWYPGDNGRAVVNIRDLGKSWESVLLRY